MASGDNIAPISADAAGRLLAKSRDGRLMVNQVAARIMETVGEAKLCRRMLTFDSDEALRLLEQRLQQDPVRTLKGLRQDLEGAQVYKGKKRGRKARSFIKWAGSKVGVMQELLAVFPSTFGTYFEPMVGSGTVFFTLKPGRAVLGDLNAELMSCYQVIRDDLQGLLQALESHDNHKEHYLKVRDQDPGELCPTERAARMIFLNKTCFNGLYRVNSRGRFNVPYGKIYWANIKDEQTLGLVSQRLQGVDLHQGDYRACLAHAAEGDLVYLDPPYLSTGPKPAIFYAYQPLAFGEQEHQRLADTFRQLDQRGCHVVLSNANTPQVRQLYQGFVIETLDTSRPLNCIASRRRGWEEVVVHNIR